MTIKIKTKSRIEKIAATSFLYALGYSHCDTLMEDLMDESSDLMCDYSGYPHVLVDVGEIDSINFCSKDDNTPSAIYTWSAQFDKIQNALLKSKTFELTDDYNAEILGTGIQVGCQFIDFATFDRFVKFVEENR